MMNTRQDLKLLSKYTSAIRLYVKRRPRLRNHLVRLRGLWHYLKYLYLVSGKKGEKKVVGEAMPALRHFARGSCSIVEELKTAFKEYTDRVSYEGMPISFESACLLWSMCETLKPKRILDLGSGFSSFVFRRYQSTAAARPEVWSVDESPEWLEKTRAYLQLHGLSDDNLYTWDAFQVLEPPVFDVISHDLGIMSERPDIFEEILALRERQGVVIIDDFQNPVYRAEINRRLRGHDTVAGYSLRWLTLDKFLRYSLLVLGRAGSHEL